MAFVTDNDIKMLRVNKRLKRMVEHGIPLAVSDTLNNVAATARIIAIKKTEKKFIKRSSWLQKGMLFQKAKSNGPISAMESRVGNTRGFAGELEGGARIPAGASHAQAPTDKSRVSKSKAKRVSKKFNRIGVGKARRMPNVNGGPKARFAAMLNIARKDNFFGPFVLTRGDIGGQRLPHGVFILGAAGRKKRGGGRMSKIRTIEKSIHIKGRPFVEPSAREASRNMDRVYIKNAEKIMAKHSGNI